MLTGWTCNRNVQPLTISKQTEANVSSNLRLTSNWRNGPWHDHETCTSGFSAGLRTQMKIAKTAIVQLDQRESVLVFIWKIYKRRIKTFHEEGFEVRLYFQTLTSWRVAPDLSLVTLILLSLAIWLARRLLHKLKIVNKNIRVLKQSMAWNIKGSCWWKPENNAVLLLLIDGLEAKIPVATNSFWN